MDWVRLGTAELQVGDCQQCDLLCALAGSLDQPGNEQIMRISFWEVKRIIQPCWCLFAIEWGFLCYFQGKGVPQMGCPAQRPALCLADLPERPQILAPCIPSASAGAGQDQWNLSPSGQPCMRHLFHVSGVLNSVTRCFSRPGSRCLLCATVSCTVPPSAGSTPGWLPAQVARQLRAA